VRFPGGNIWTGQLDRLIVIDPAAPSWDEITPSAGIVSMKAWAVDRDGAPQYSRPFGTVLLEVLADRRIRIEWFETQDDVTGFTAGSRIYEW
jgi:hypothetical protein